MPDVFNPQTINLYQPPPASHKGQNGKLLVIGGSKLFHTSIFWAADIASRIVDIVHFSSPANENNQVVRTKIKQNFWTGIVVDWTDVEAYIQEDDAILIGPGMTRTDETALIVDFLLKKYPTKKWVLDGGALQGVDPELITESCILTPHAGEFNRLARKVGLGVEAGKSSLESSFRPPNPSSLSKSLNNCTILLKGPVDTVCQGTRCVEIPAGNPGMTKGGTGDVLAGLVAALYCKNDAWTAAAAGSWVNKQAGDELYEKVGPYFNAQDLVEAVPKVLGKLSRQV